MPVRTKAVSTALRAILKPERLSFNNVSWTAQVNDEVMTRDDFDARFWDPADEAFVEVVDSIDWGRVFIEAQSRHIALGHDDEDRYSFPRTEDICPECLCEALLAGDTYMDWKRNPKVPRDKREYS